MHQAALSRLGAFSSKIGSLVCYGCTSKEILPLSLEQKAQPGLECGYLVIASVPVSFCCLTHYPRTQWCKATTSRLAHDSVGRLGSSPGAGWLSDL